MTAVEGWGAAFTVQTRLEGHTLAGWHTLRLSPGLGTEKQFKKKKITAFQPSQHRTKHSTCTEICPPLSLCGFPGSFILKEENVERARKKKCSSVSGLYSLQVNSEGRAELQDTGTASSCPSIVHPSPTHCKTAWKRQLGQLRAALPAASGYRKVVSGIQRRPKDCHFQYTGVVPLEWGDQVGKGMPTSLGNMEHFSMGEVVTPSHKDARSPCSTSKGK